MSEYFRICGVENFLDQCESKATMAQPVAREQTGYLKMTQVRFPIETDLSI